MGARLFSCLEKTRATTHFRQATYLWKYLPRTATKTESELMEGDENHDVLKRHYSTIGIQDVFLSPLIRLEQLPQSYLKNVATIPAFCSPEIVGTIKSVPQDFIVREIASPKLGVADDVADIIPAVEPEAKAKAPQEEATTTATEKPGSKSRTAIEIAMDPKQVIRQILTHHLDATTAESQLVALQDLHDEALAGLLVQECNNMPTAPQTSVLIKPIPKDTSCIADTTTAVTRGGDRGSLHRCIRRAFSLLKSESQPDESIKISINDTFFGLSPSLANPQRDLIGLMEFQNKGCPADASSNKRKRSSEYQMVLPLKPHISRDDRRALHHLISSSTRDFETSTDSHYKMLPDGKTSAIVVTWSKTAQRRLLKSGTSPVVEVFVLKKTGKEHLTALLQLCSAIKCRQSDLGMAGIKDMLAVTYQFCTLRRQSGRPVDVKRVNEILSAKGMEIAVVSSSSTNKNCFLHVGELQGNRFVVTIRNPQHIRFDGIETKVALQDRAFLTERADAIRQHGFINFYGEQRVGIAGYTEEVGFRSHDIGKAMLQRNFDKAIDALIKGRLICRGQDEVENKQALKCRQIWKDTDGNVEETYKALPKGESMARERTILQGLKRYHNSLEALKCLHYNFRIFWINAYQSYVWNKMASERIKLYGTNVVVGDLIMSPDKETRVKTVATQEEAAATRLDQVVLPLPGHNVRYPENEIGIRYQELLSSEEVKFEKDAPLEATAKGSYRSLIISVDNLQVDFPEDDDAAIPYFQISFDLPSGCYATMLLREFMVTTVTRF